MGISKFINFIFFCIWQRKNTICISETYPLCTCFHDREKMCVSLLHSPLDLSFLAISVFFWHSQRKVPMNFNISGLNQQHETCVTMVLKVILDRRGTAMILATVLQRGNLV